ncbi:hypothetical protein H0H92_000578 [Tricholoma furcatifolium]|nr:hypothetical protein H0H92_000578 [Tricholoma furcatifolium]
MAKQCNGTFLDWTTRILPQESRYTLLSMVESYGAYGYNDYTVFTLLDGHPISQLEQLEHSKLRSCIEQRKLPNHVPYVEELCSVPMNFQLLPAFETPKRVASSSHHPSHEDLQSPSSDAIPILSSPIYTHPQSSSSSMIITSSSIVPYSTFLTPKSHVKSENESPAVIDLCTPQKPVKLEPFSVKTVQKPNGQRSIKMEQVDVKSEKENDSSIIDLCTPPRNSSVGKAKLLSESPVIAHVQRRTVEAAPGIVRVGSVYESLDAARDAIFQSEERMGYTWRTGQSRKDMNSQLRKVIFRCNCYAEHKPVRSLNVDPSEY